MSLRRRLRQILERALDVRIVHRGAVALVFEQEHLNRFFERFGVDCVFDVGANAGQYAQMLRSQAGYRGDIISYESNPEQAALLRANARGDPRWHVEEVALDSAAGHATFNVFAGDQFSSLHDVADTASLLFERKTQLARRIEVQTVTLFDEIEKYRVKLAFSHPFLKMDTQGHDLAVATGAGERLRDFVGLQSELAIERLYRDAPLFTEALEFYRARGFELSALVPNNLGHFPRLLEIDCIMFRK